jgi:hypothetical protein
MVGQRSSQGPAKAGWGVGVGRGTQGRRGSSQGVGTRVGCGSGTHIQELPMQHLYPCTGDRGGAGGHVFSTRHQPHVP